VSVCPSLLVTPWGSSSGFARARGGGGCAIRGVTAVGWSGPGCLTLRALRVFREAPSPVQSGMPVPTAAAEVLGELACRAAALEAASGGNPLECFAAVPDPRRRTRLRRRSWRRPGQAAYALDARVAPHPATPWCAARPAMTAWFRSCWPPRPTAPGRAGRTAHRPWTGRRSPCRTRPRRKGTDGASAAPSRS
jgi:hypothetical protein